eukprot:gnl/TRDRNA2_/TRDRNA2_107784_c1_seq1.p1 gnl/TRDRNA2_/TRDRNA2_107784_c1~~gnl/TRDRNA2_/TRDRNA2_107784_c1_seq1.p1  ORF type:complete len:291 (+),score=36.61 gnl/TRDRNA2_/TRDRNA2_107784_c1_seq1:102-875(+)
MVPVEFSATALVLAAGKRTWLLMVLWGVAAMQLIYFIFVMDGPPADQYHFVLRRLFVALPSMALHDWYASRPKHALKTAAVLCSAGLFLWNAPVLISPTDASPTHMLRLTHPIVSACGAQFVVATLLALRFSCERHTWPHCLQVILRVCGRLCLGVVLVHCSQYHQFLSIYHILEEFMHSLYPDGIHVFCFLTLNIFLCYAVAFGLWVTVQHPAATVATFLGHQAVTFAGRLAGAMRLGYRQCFACAPAESSRPHFD